MLIDNPTSQISQCHYSKLFKNLFFMFCDVHCGLLTVISLRMRVSYGMCIVLVLRAHARPFEIRRA